MPGKVGGETDIIIGVKYLKYFPKETYKLPSGLTIFEAMFKNLDGSKGVVAGPHPLITNEWDKIGQVAHSHVVIPVNRENLESPDCNSESPPPPHAGNLASRHKNRRKRPKRKKSNPPFSCDVHPYNSGCHSNKKEDGIMIDVDANVNVSKCASLLHPLISVLGLFCNKILQNCTGFIYVLIAILGYICMILQKCKGQFKPIFQKVLNSSVLASFRIISKRYAKHFKIDPGFPIFAHLLVWAYFCVYLQKYAGCLKLTHKFQTFFKVLNLHIVTHRCSNMQIIFRIFQFLLIIRHVARNCRKLQNNLKYFPIFINYRFGTSCKNLQEYTHFYQNRNKLPILITHHVTMGISCDGQPHRKWFITRASGSWVPT